MERQLDLEDLARDARARPTDPWTSHAAARSIPYDKLRESQKAVHECFMAFGPMNHESLVYNYGVGRKATVYHWPRQSESGLRTRTKELRDAGFIEDTGETMLLDSGRQSKVWKAT